MKKLFNFLPYILSFLFLISKVTFAHAQNEPSPDSDNNIDNVLRSNGMIYVVVGVIVIILGGVILYLTSIDKKITKLEKEMHENK